MTVMIPLFFGMPQSLIRTGKLKNLGGIAAKVMIALWHESERTRSRELVLTAKQLNELMGGHRNSIAAAQSELVERGLVVAEPYGDKGFVYVLCDPETGKPWNGLATDRIPYVRKTLGGAGEGRPKLKNQDITRSQLVGTRFPFGCNAPDQQPNDAHASNALPWSEIAGKI